MKRLHVVYAISLTLLATTGCSNPASVANIDTPSEPYPQRQSQAWCQENYSAASVSARDRQANAKFCDELARRKYMEAARQRNRRDEPLHSLRE